MVRVGAAREAARSRLAKRLGQWAGEVAAGGVMSAPIFTLALKPPTERQALADLAAAREWAQEWYAVPDAPGQHVEFVTRKWHSVSTQRLPVRLSFSSVDALAAFVGGASEREWRSASERATTAASTLGASAALGAAVRRHFRAILAYTPNEWRTVLQLTAWLAAHSVAGLRPRQLPLRGGDTKWFGAHRAVVSDLLAAAAPTHELGVVDSDSLVRVRVLDATIALGGVQDFAAPVAQLATLAYRPRFVFVFENKESVLAMPPWPGAIAVHGGGFAIAQIAALPWVQASPVIYWGDLDSAGFAILHALRSHHPNVTSVLMDEATLLAHRDLWVREPTPHRGSFDTLLPHEQAARARLRDEADVRLEQERIPWATALAALEHAVLHLRPERDRHHFDKGIEPLEIARVRGEAR